MEKRTGTTLMTLAACAVVVLAVLAAHALGGRGEAAAVDKVPVGQISAAGTGKAIGTPDVMRFTVGVDLTRSDVDEAVTASNALMRKVLRSVRSHKVADRDIKTSRYAIEPRYDYSGNTERLTGYNVTQRARITLRDLAKAGAAITGIARSGGNDVRVEGIAFEVSDPESLLDEARADAVEQARAHAETYARAAGAKLGKVVEVRESPASQPHDTGYAARDLSALKDAPIEPGESELQVRVSVTWSLR